jgi:hypothetical protein
MTDVKIYKKYSFVEYLGSSIAAGDLSVEALSNIDKIFGISEDNDHLIEFSPNDNYNELQLLEKSKRYLILANSDNPEFILYSY